MNRRNSSKCQKYFPKKKERVCKTPERFPVEENISQTQENISVFFKAKCHSESRKTYFSFMKSFFKRYVKKYKKGISKLQKFLQKKKLSSQMQMNFLKNESFLRRRKWAFKTSEIFSFQTPDKFV